MDEMLSAAVDPDKGSIYYKDYTALMVVDDDSIWNSRAVGRGWGMAVTDLLTLSICGIQKLGM